MKTSILFILAILVLSCTKDNETVEPLTAKNKFDATITFASGEVRQFSATGVFVSFSCDSRGTGSYINTGLQGDDDMYLYFINAPDCVTKPGTYSFICNYHPDARSWVSSTYTSFAAKHPGSVTYTFFNGRTVQGHFETYCKVNMEATDSVLVKGTFSGYLQ